MGLGVSLFPRGTTHFQFLQTESMNFLVYSKFTLTAFRRFANVLFRKFRG